MWTLYTSSGDVVLLNAIFNGVAMIANNTATRVGLRTVRRHALLTTKTPRRPQPSRAIAAPPARC
jgi:hypothetical protein